MIFFRYLTFLCLLIVHSSSALEFKCDFNEWTGWDYGCLVVKGTIRSRENSTITVISGAHKENKTDKDVVWISIESRLMNYFPRNLGKFFTNLTTIYLAKSKLKEIQTNDFVSLNKLKNLFLDYNEIAKVDVNSFRALPTLHSLSFDFNKCHSNSAYYNRTAVLSLIGEIKAKCYDEDEYAAPAAEEAINVEQEVKLQEHDEDIEENLTEMRAKIAKLGKF